MKPTERLQAAVLEHGALLSVEEAAGVLGVSTGTVRRMVTAGEIPAAQLGGVRHRPIRISASTLNKRMRGWSQRG